MEQTDTSASAIARTDRETRRETLNAMQGLLVSITIQAEEMPDKKDQLNYIANLLAHACNEYECLIL